MTSKLEWAKQQRAAGKPTIPSTIKASSSSAQSHSRTALCSLLLPHEKSCCIQITAPCRPEPTQLTAVGGAQGELAYNPFLRCDDTSLAAAWGVQPGCALLARLRAARDAFGGPMAVAMNWVIWFIQHSPLTYSWGLYR